MAKTIWTIVFKWPHGFWETGSITSFSAPHRIPHTMDSVSLTFGAGLVLGTIAFQLWPDSNSVLYLDYSGEVGNTCTTSAEWIWIFATSSLILLPTALIWCCKRISLDTLKRQPPLSGSCQLKLRTFLVINLLWFAASLVQPLLRNRHRTPSVLDVLEILGAKAAWPALWNLAAVVFPVQRISPLQRLVFQSSLSHKETTVLHIWTGNAVLFWLLFHAAFTSTAYAIRLSWEEWRESMLPFRGFYTEGVVNAMGWGGLLMLLALVATSQLWFRRLWYEAFTGFHLSFTALLIFFSNLHDYNTLHFVQPALVAWITERLLRKYSRLQTRVKAKHTPGNSNISDDGDLIICMNHTSTEQPAADAPIIALTLSIPRSWTSEPRSGMFVYLKVPSISPWQSHPISISRIDPTNQTISFHIKALGDWTSAFVSKIHEAFLLPSPESLPELSSNPQQSLHVHTSESADSNLQALPFDFDIEGPYGADMHASLDCYANCLFLVGGVGLTGVSEAVRNRSVDTGRRTFLVWLVRTADEMEFLSQDLLPCHQDGATQCNVFVTGSSERSQPSHATKLVRSYKVKFSGHLKSFYDPISTTVASIVSVALSFAVSRAICCNYHVVDTAGTIDSKCSLVGDSTACVSCDAETIKSGDSFLIPCCKPLVCFYCFRGLPAVLSLLFAPLCALVLLYVFHRIRRLVNKGNGCCCSRSGLPNTGNALHGAHGSSEQYESVAESQRSTRTNDILIDEDVIQNHITVEYRRPELADILNDYLHNCHEYPPPGESNKQAAAVVVCGSPSFIRSVSDEVHMLRRVSNLDSNHEGPSAADLKLVILNPSS